MAALCPNRNVFGIGSYTYQYNTRDTFGFAMKATAGNVNGTTREIFKDPITDSGMKKSAKGFLAVHRDNISGQYYLKQNAALEEVENCSFAQVYRDGTVTKDHTLHEIRCRIQETNPPGKK